LKNSCKVWLDNGGKAFVEGPFKIMKKIEKIGSLHQAAIDLKISYQKVWGMFRPAEGKLGFDFLEKKVVGIAGGFAVDTCQKDISEKV
jgi:molybdate transport repressor ModE-like protein